MKQCLQVFWKLSVRKAAIRKNELSWNGKVAQKPADLYLSDWPGNRLQFPLCLSIWM
jgi:hypothetical protein